MSEGLGHFVFGARSCSNLAEVDERLRAVCHAALRLTPLDFAVLTGHRGRAAQEAAVRAGKSRKRWPDSAHNARPARAVDVAPWPIDWRDTERFVFLAGVFFAAAKLEGVGLRWGGDWDGDLRTLDEGFRDYGHFELAD